ncbi:MAG TPA: alcohol dehydrogenase catalytic domain-containing protein, partial [Candidatus Synoicihabitans sp.]|nr:alcohol dehydrogenase catalytic domain-containing protein [Candidatus Synoicihabitans sp.]
MSEAIAAPEAGTGEVLIQVETSGVNFIDCYFRSGLYPAQVPFTVGQEVAGVVTQIGEGVTEVKLGDRIATAAARGGYAEYAVASVHQCVRVPDTISSRLAAAVWLQGLTAHYLATDTFPIVAGHAALVYAAAGGVGRL